MTESMCIWDGLVVHCQRCAPVRNESAHLKGEGERPSTLKQIHQGPPIADAILYQVTTTGLGEHLIDTEAGFQSENDTPDTEGPT